MSLVFADQKTELRILFVIGSLELGGAESQMLMLVRELTHQKIDCEVFAVQASGALRGAFDELGIPVHCGRYDYTSRKLAKGFQLIRAAWLLWLHARRATVLQAYLPLTNFMGACAGYLAGVDKIITCRRGLGNHQDRHSGWKLFDRIANSLSDVVVVNSQMVAEDTVRRDGIRRDKLICIYNGIDTGRIQRVLPQREVVRQSLGLALGQVTLIIVANLIPYKGHAELIDALSRLLPRFPDLQLLVVGQDRGIMAQLTSQAATLGVGAAIQWLGLRRDVPELLSAADIYVCASHEEGFSNSLLEALAAGKPAVATSVGGNAEMLENGALGVLVNPHAPDELAAAISDLIADPARRAHMGHRARLEVERRYSVGHMAAQYIRLYENK